MQIKSAIQQKAKWAFHPIHHITFISYQNNNQIFASKYLLELPTPEILQQEIIRERLQIDANIHSRSV